MDKIILELSGTVQGIGLRPSLKRLADAAGLVGWVQNRPEGVQLCLLGAPEALNIFLAEFPNQLPPHAHLEKIRILHQEPFTESPPPGFTILASAMVGKSPRMTIPPDLNTCPECLNEVFDPTNRRYGYPFTTCTACGPRLTVVTALPYDRQRTTLAAFPLCPACQQEYDDPKDCRFHAESIACPVCGPQLFFLNGNGEPMAGDPLQLARKELAKGKIIAVRGLGGYQLAVHAGNREAIARLRQRKERPSKPLAVMAKDLETIRAWCHLSVVADSLLTGPAGPILILHLRKSPPANGPLAVDLIAPDTDGIGVMLPSTPLHRLLLTPLSGDPIPASSFLVLTSGNSRGDPIVTSNAEALTALAGIADGFLMHQREIALRADDSVGVANDTGIQLWRRARGYALGPVSLPFRLSRTVLAMGAEWKNTVAIGDGNEVILSPHVGDLATPASLGELERFAARLPAFLGRTIQAVAVDLHPDFHSARIGRALAARWGAPVIPVQHHHAHAMACLIEAGLTEGLALVWDGTGLGSDGLLWGAELLYLTRDGGWQRLGSFLPVSLPGGEAAIRQPVRQLVARLDQAGIDPLDPRWLARLAITGQQAQVWLHQSRTGLNAPISHAAGRVCDSLAALLGLAPLVIDYEGQAAIRLETAARQAIPPWPNPLPLHLLEQNGILLVDWRPAFRQLALTPWDPESVPGWAMSCHQTMIQAGLALAAYGQGRTGCARIALTGGVMQNRILAEELPRGLRQLGLDPILPGLIPPNDGGIALGQAVIAGRSR